MKKLIAAIFGASFLISVPFAASAKEAKVTLPSFDVTLNGTVIENTNREYPLIVYNDITYFPMTYYDCRYLGLTTDWNNDTRTLSIDKDNITCAYRDYKTQNTNSKAYTASVCEFKINVNGEKIDNSVEEYPLLTFRDITYFPLTWRFAYEEFGWEYSFTNEDGLRIGSDNFKSQTLKLPGISGSLAFDGEYYYYNSTDGVKGYVSRALADDPSEAEIIYELPDTPMTRGATFTMGTDGIYFSYQQGSVPTTSTAAFKKINPDGTVVDGRNKADYAYGKHGSYELSTEKGGISVNITAYGAENIINGITVTKNGEKKEITDFPKSLSITYCMIDGKYFERVGALSRVKILGEKIYISAYDFEEKSGNNDLFVIDTATGETKRLIYGLEGAFHVYYGWSNELEGQTEMILFCKDGNLMRYTEKDGKIKEVDSFAKKDGLILERAQGAQKVYTVFKSIGGDKTVVREYDDYASGYGSINTTVFETSTGTNHSVSDGHLVVRTAGESPDDSIRTAVFPWGDGNTYFYTSDAVTDLFVYDDTIIYTLADGTVVRVDK